jgi:leader peptidase (prepilin peptidase) / N-methyltransferase
MIIILIALLGVALGSFVNALEWRVYLREQLTGDSGHGKKLAKSKKQKDEKRRAKYSITKGRSMCPECRHELAASDLVPVLNWIFLKGRCRYCQKPISIQYPAVELVTAGLLTTSYVLWPYTFETGISYAVFSLWTVALVLGVALAVYDLKRMVLPNRLVYPFTAVCAVFLGVLSLQAESTNTLTSGLIGAAMFSGFFYLLYQISGGKWIGGGDVRLAVGLGLLLGWQKSILALMLAAYAGTAVIAVLVVIKKYHRKMKLPFGPFLLVAAYLAVLFGQQCIDWYMRISGL